MENPQHFLELDKSVQINLDQFVSLHSQPDGKMVACMAAPGPDGRNSYPIPPEAMLLLESWVAPRRLRPAADKKMD